MITTYDSVLGYRGAVFGVDSVLLVTLSGGTTCLHMPWDATKSELDNYLAGVSVLIATVVRNDPPHVVSVARLPMSTLNTSPYAFLLSYPIVT